MDTISPGVTQKRFGTPENLTPVSLRQHPISPRLSDWDCNVPCPLSLENIDFETTPRGCNLRIPLLEDEEIYGFGLQFYSLGHRGKKKTLRVNSDPLGDSGDSHAPVPFYVSTRGYAVLVDTARYATFYCGSTQSVANLMDRVLDSAHQSPAINGSIDATQARSAEALYENVALASAPLLVEIPIASGVDVYVFWGEAMREAVQRYNLFSGGGCVPPRWGLGVWYRTRSDFDSEQIGRFAEDWRNDEMPCDVLGFEAGWQSNVYPCSFEWSYRFPDPKALLDTLKTQNFRVNLWTHLFTQPSAPLATALREFSGNYSGFNGLLPDLSLPQAREIITNHHRATHL